MRGLTTIRLGPHLGIWFSSALQAGAVWLIVASLPGHVGADGRATSVAPAPPPTCEIEQLEKIDGGQRAKLEAKAIGFPKHSKLTFTWKSGPGPITVNRRNDTLVGAGDAGRIICVMRSGAEREMVGQDTEVRLIVKGSDGSEAMCFTWVPPPTP